MIVHRWPTRVHADASCLDRFKAFDAPRESIVEPYLHRLLFSGGESQGSENQSVVARRERFPVGLESVRQAERYVP